MLRGLLLLSIFISLATNYKLNAQNLEFNCTLDSSYLSTREIKNATYVCYNLQLSQSSQNIEPLLDIQLRDQVLKALVAVKKSSLAARDTVYKYLDINCPTLELHNFVLFQMDSSLSWLQNLCNHITPSGNNRVDSLFDVLGINVDSCDYNSLLGSMLYVSSDTDIVDLGLANTLIPDLQVYIEPIVGAQSYIIGDIDSTGISLDYSMGWGDCQAGCSFRRTWTFHVDTGCQVSYVGVKGDPYDWSGTDFGNVSVHHNNISSSKYIFPNPLIDHSFYVDKSLIGFPMDIYSIRGDKVLHIDHLEPMHRLDMLSPGIYFWKSNTREHSFQGKIVVE